MGFEEKGSKKNNGKEEIQEEKRRGKGKRDRNGKEKFATFYIFDFACFLGLLKKSLSEF